MLMGWHLHATVNLSIRVISCMSDQCHVKVRICGKVSKAHRDTRLRRFEQVLMPLQALQLILHFRYDCGWRGCTSHGFTSFHELLNHALATHMHSPKVNSTRNLPRDNDESDFDADQEQVSTLVATARPVEGSETMCQWEGCRFQVRPSSLTKNSPIGRAGKHCCELAGAYGHCTRRLVQ